MNIFLVLATTLATAGSGSPELQVELAPAGTTKAIVEAIKASEEQEPRAKFWSKRAHPRVCKVCRGVRHVCVLVKPIADLGVDTVLIISRLAPR